MGPSQVLSSHVVSRAFSCASRPHNTYLINKSYSSFSSYSLLVGVAGGEQEPASRLNLLPPPRK